MFFRMLEPTALFAGACLSLAAHAESNGAPPFNNASVRPAAASALYREMAAAEAAAGAARAIEAGTAVLMKALNGRGYEQFVLAL